MILKITRAEWVIWLITWLIVYTINYRQLQFVISEIVTILSYCLISHCIDESHDELYCYINSALCD